MQTLCTHTHTHTYCRIFEYYSMESFNSYFHYKQKCHFPACQFFSLKFRILVLYITKMRNNIFYSWDFYEFLQFKSVFVFTWLWVVENSWLPFHSNSPSWTQKIVKSRTLFFRLLNPYFFEHSSGTVICFILFLDIENANYSLLVTGSIWIYMNIFMMIYFLKQCL